MNVPLLWGNRGWYRAQVDYRVTQTWITSWEMCTIDVDVVVVAHHFQSISWRGRRKSGGIDPQECLQERNALCRVCSILNSAFQHVLELKVP